MPIESLKEIEDLDTRREVVRLLQLLSPAQRVAYLEWCTSIANDRIMLTNDPPWVLVRISNATGDAVETFLDLATMIAQYGMPIQTALAELERLVSLNTAGKDWSPDCGNQSITIVA